MSDKPMIFSAPMIRALLAGTKTQTRRVLKPQPRGDVIQYSWTAEDGAYFMDQDWKASRLRIWAGDRLWVRETWARNWNQLSDISMDRSFVYRASGDKPAMDNGSELPWRSTIRMPRALSRLTLTVTDVRVQRLQDISEADAIAEGIYRVDPTPEDHDWWRKYCVEYGGDPEAPMSPVWMAPGTRRGWGMSKEERNKEEWGPTPQFAYRCLWNAIHGPAAWDENPWVCAISFEAHRCNIDALNPVCEERP